MKSFCKAVKTHTNTSRLEMIGNNNNNINNNNHNHKKKTQHNMKLQFVIIQFLI